MGRGLKGECLLADCQVSLFALVAGGLQFLFPNRCHLIRVAAVPGGGRLVVQ